MRALSRPHTHALLQRIIAWCDIHTYIHVWRQTHTHSHAAPRAPRVSFLTRAVCIRMSKRHIAGSGEALDVHTHVFYWGILVCLADAFSCVSEAHWCVIYALCVYLVHTHVSFMQTYVFNWCILMCVTDAQAPRVCKGGHPKAEKRVELETFRENPYRTRQVVIIFAGWSGIWANFVLCWGASQ